MNAAAQGASPVKLLCSDAAKTSVRVGARSRGEVQNVFRSARSPIAEHQAPKSREDQWLSRGIGELTYLSAGRRIVCGNLAISEVADQNVIAESSEVGGSQCQSPGGIQRALGYEALHEISVKVEDIYQAKAGAGDGIGLGCILLCVGHKELAIDVANVVGCESSRQTRIGESSGQGLRREIRVVYLNLPREEVAHIKQCARPIHC